jgi:AraC-like DNA-binding protein
MEVVNLPYDIFGRREMGEDEVIVHEYAARKGTFRGRSILHTNAISLVLEGQKTMHFAQETVVVTEDSFHLLAAGNCLASIDLSRQDVFRSLLIFFTDKVLAGFYLKYQNAIDAYKKKHNVVSQAYISVKKDGFIRNYIAGLQQNQHSLSAAMKQLKLEELLLYMLENCPGRLLAFNPSGAHAAELSLRRVVETNILNNLSVEELAFLCNLSVSTFKRHFQKIYGSSPSKWFLHKKMEMAANLLRNRRERPSEVFHQVGYETHSSFAKSFKQVFGKTPREYQQQP